MPTIAIVGTGPTAIYTLQHLVSQPKPPLTILMFEAGHTAGVGTPYDPERNSVEMLANIASVELPPVCETLVDYLRRCSDDLLAEWSIDRADLDERGFYPRVALGSYFAEQLAGLQDAARAAGHDVRLFTDTRVRDIVPVEDAIRVVVEQDRRIRSFQADKLVLATGHFNVAGPPQALAGLNDDAHEIAILGSSLSAIDLAVAIATDRGLFAGSDDARSGSAPSLRLTMMSRGGRLPEADFFCPLPTTEAVGFGEADVLRIVDAAEPGHVLDAVFAAFAAVLAAHDPAYAKRIGLGRLDADTFADAYFDERDASDPFAWARLNLEEVRRNAEARHVVPWRYTILRCHEAFAACLPALDAEERRRFGAGLKRVFIDNYAAVPPASIERLLRLHDSGVLRLEKLDADYRLEWRAGGAGAVLSGDKVLRFDRIFDARGQAVADDETFPFPTLRTLLLANHDLDESHGDRAVRVDESYRLIDGVNRLRDIWCCSLPFLLDRQPFIQGLTNCAEMGEVAAGAILADLAVSPAKRPVAMSDLMSQIQTTSPVLMTDGLVLLAAHASEAAPREVEAGR